MDIAATLDHFLTVPAATSPSYAGDGRLYFLSDTAGSAQVWELPADGSPARPRSTGADAVNFVAGHPTSGGAVFGRDNAGDDRIQLYWLDADGAAERALTAEPATLFGWGAYSPDGSQIACTANKRHPAHADPVIIDLATGSQRRVTDLEGPHSLEAWQPDGAALTVSAAPRTFKSDLFAANLVSGARRPLTPENADARHLGVRWRKDGAAFWLLTDRGRDYLAVATLAPGGDPTLLYAPDSDVETMAVSPDQSLLAVVVNESGYSRLRLLDAQTGAVVEEPVHPAGTITKATWRPDGGGVAFDLATPEQPSTLWLAERGAPVRPLFAAGAAPEGALPYRLVQFPQLRWAQHSSLLGPTGWPGAREWLARRGLGAWRPRGTGAADLAARLAAHAGHGHGRAHSQRARQHRLWPRLCRSG